MKRLTIITALLVFVLTTANAQTTFVGGDIEFAAGIGLLPTFVKDDATTIVPPVSARLGVRLAPNFSLGAYAAYSSSESLQRELPDGAIEDLSNEFFMVGLRAAAHASRIENWDIYGGAMIGYNMPNVSSEKVSEKSNSDGPSFSRPAENEFTYSAFVGASYYPVKNLGVFAEIGYGISLLNMGVSLKI